MKTIKLKVNDKIFKDVISFLKKLPENRVNFQVEDDSKHYQSGKLKAISIRTKNFKFDREEANAR